MKVTASGRLVKAALVVHMRLARARKSVSLSSGLVNGSEGFALAFPGGGGEGSSGSGWADRDDLGVGGQLGAVDGSGGFTDGGDKRADDRPYLGAVGGEGLPERRLWHRECG